MKIFNIILCILFVLFAAVQYNDPDPYIWASIYLFVAGVCGYAAYGKYNSRVTWVGLIIIGAYMISYIPAFVDWIKMGMPSIVETMKAEKSYVELTREFGGLVICVVTLGWQLYRNSSKFQATPQ